MPQTSELGDFVLKGHCDDSSVEHATVFAQQRHSTVLVGGDLLGCAAGRQRHLSPTPERAIDAAANAYLVAGSQKQTRQYDDCHFHLVTLVS